MNLLNTQCSNITAHIKCKGSGLHLVSYAMKKGFKRPKKKKGGGGGAKKKNVDGLLSVAEHWGGWGRSGRWTPPDRIAVLRRRCYLELPPRRDGRRGRCGARRTAVTDVSEAAGGRPRLLPLLPGVLLHQ